MDGDSSLSIWKSNAAATSFTELFATRVNATTSPGAGFPGAPIAFNEETTIAPGEKVYFYVTRNGVWNNDGTNLSAQIDLTPIPEPTSLALLGLGLLGLVSFRGRRRRR